MEKSINKRQIKNAGSCLYIVDQTLHHPNLGHHAEYNFSLYDSAEKSGLNPVILASKDWHEPVKGRRVYPAFAAKWGFGLGRTPRVKFRTNMSDSVDSLFGRDLLLAIRRYSIQSKDRIFIHSMGFSEIDEIAHIFSAESESTLPEFHLLFRRDLTEAGTGPEFPLYSRFISNFCLLKQLDLIGSKIFLYTDTEELAEQYSSAVGLTFNSLPIPFDTQALSAAQAKRGPRQGDAPLIIGYLGDARPEKGYQHLPRLVKALHPLTQEGKIRFFFQSNYNLPGGEPGIAKARDLLRRYPDACVGMANDPLSKEDYYERLVDCDIILIPYEAHRYVNRSSGVLAQALAAGKIPVVPSGTWMSRIVAGLGIDPRYQFTFDTNTDFIDAVRNAITLFNKAKLAYSAIATEWRGRCEPDLLLARLGNARAKGAEKRRPSVLHVIDGDGFYYKGGAAVIQNNQRRYLQSIGARIFTVFVVRSPLGEEELPKWERIIQEFCKEEGLDYAWLSYLRTYEERDSESLSGQMRRCGQLTIPATLDFILKRKSLDFVLHNYVVTMPFLKLLNVDSRTPIISELHDIQSYQIALLRKDEEINDEELALEVEQLRFSSICISLNGTETEKLKQLSPNLKIETIAPYSFDHPLTVRDMAGPQDLAELVSTTESDLGFVNFGKSINTPERWQLEKLFEEKSIDMLFLSSWHVPNVMSLEWFFEEIYMKYLYPKGHNLFLAGNISDLPIAWAMQKRCPKVYIVGKVQNYRPLYAATRVVLLPIVTSAGINIKAIESIAFAKPFVATSQCLGDIKLAPRNIHTFDSADKFAAEILRLLSERTARVELHERLLPHSEQYGNFSRFRQQWNDVVSQVVPDWSGMISTEAARTSRVERPFVEWSQPIGDLSRFFRHVLNGEYVDARVSNSLVEGHLSSSRFSDHYLEVLDELAIKQTAPILRLQPGAITADIEWCKSYSPIKLLEVILNRFMSVQDTTVSLSDNLVRRSVLRSKRQALYALLIFANIGDDSRLDLLNRYLRESAINFARNVYEPFLKNYGIELFVYTGGSKDEHWGNSVHRVSTQSELTDFLDSVGDEISVFAHAGEHLVFNPDLYCFYRKLVFSQLPLVAFGKTLWFAGSDGTATMPENPMALAAELAARLGISKNVKSEAAAVRQAMNQDLKGGRLKNAVRKKRVKSR